MHKINLISGARNPHHMSTDLCTRCGLQPLGIRFVHCGHRLVCLIKIALSTNGLLHTVMLWPVDVIHQHKLWTVCTVIPQPSLSMLDRHCYNINLGICLIIYNIQAHLLYALRCILVASTHRQWGLSQFILTHFEPLWYSLSVIFLSLSHTHTHTHTHRHTSISLSLLLAGTMASYCRIGGETGDTSSYRCLHSHSYLGLEQATSMQQGVRYSVAHPELLDLAFVSFFSSIQVTSITCQVDSAKSEKENTWEEG